MPLPWSEPGTWTGVGWLSDNAPQGWYPQPDGRQRYWDGSSWGPFYPESPPYVTPTANWTPSGPQDSSTVAATGRSRSWIVGIAIAIGAAVVVLIVVGVIALSKTPHQDASTASSGRQPSANSASSVPEAQSTTTDVSAVAAEYQPFLADFTSLLQEAGAKSNAGDLVGTAALLTQVGQKAQEGKTLPAFGIPGVDTEWSAAMDDFITASQVGVPAMLSGDQAGIAQAASYIERATAHLNAATASLPN